MGGDTGGNDCVHVIDVRAPRETVASLGRVVSGPMLRPDTDVIIHDEHGNVCQFTYQEWTDFALKMKRDEFDHIGPDVTGEAVTVKIDLSGVDPNVTGMDPSAIARLDALPSVSGTISGTFSAAERDQTVYAVLGTFIPHTAEATGTPEHLRAVADELERRDAQSGPVAGYGKWHIFAEGRECARYSRDRMHHENRCPYSDQPDPSDQPPGRTPSRAEGEAKLREWGIL